MSASSESSKAKTWEAKAVDAERSISQKSTKNASLDAAIASAEFYMQALKLSTRPAERRRLDLKFKELLAKAESIKAAQDGKPAMAKAYPGDMKQPKSTRKLTTRENIILLEGSKLNGAIFKPWVSPPTQGDFELKDGSQPFLDLPHLPLSPAQQQSFAGWRRPQEALPMIEVRKDGIMLSNDPTMVRAGKIDLVQDMTSDCSVVASLCAGTARAERGHPRVGGPVPQYIEADQNQILGSILYPYDYDQDQIILSPNGKYILNLYFNGCWRRVEIDDLLPTSKTSRVLHVIDRAHPGLLWPALVEKAYLKVRGGYDFPGSNSGTDLAVLTGWIPQQVFLHDEDVDTDELWNELYNAFGNGNMLLTIGTGKLPRREQKQLGLAAEHDYAILELKMTSDVKEMLIKNPWSDGDVWIGASKRRPNPSHESESDKDSTTNDPEMMPGTFWMDFSSIFHFFENMYINWNPGLFTDRQDLHFTWNLQETSFTPNIFVENPQFSVQTSKAGDMWLLLNRHFRTGDYTHANSGKNGYISLYLFAKGGFKVLPSDGAVKRGAFVDSPNTLLRFKADANTAYTAVVVTQDLPPGKHNFTLSALANSTISLEDSRSRYSNQISLPAAWTRANAGGNSDSARYLSNPQFACLVLASGTKAAVVLRITSDPMDDLGETNIHVRLLVVFNPSNRRITKLRPRDVVAHSGDYRRGSAVIETTLAKGNYAIVCSTFEENQLAKFQLDLHSSSPSSPDTGATLKPIPAEASGRLSIVTQATTLPTGISMVVARMTIPRVTRAIFIGRPFKEQTTQSAPSLLCKLSIQQGQGPYARTVASSADDTSEFSNVASGLRIEDQDLNPQLLSSSGGDLWLVWERPSGHISSSDNGTSMPLALEVEILAEERIEIGEWQMIRD